VEGYVRTFVDEGSAMAGLLREAAARGIMPEYAGRLLLAFDAKHQRSAGESLLPATSALTSATSHAAQVLIEPLTQRERDVLRLLKTDLAGPEIAAELVIAVSTVHSHTKSIYSKLNVTNRRAAVRRAAELGLL
jgi:LuxR family maltose regulon positive regulatory protein